MNLNKMICNRTHCEPKVPLTVLACGAWCDLTATLVLNTYMHFAMCMTFCHTIPKNTDQNMPGSDQRLWYVMKAVFVWNIEVSTLMETVA